MSSQANAANLKAIALLSQGSIVVVCGYSVALSYTAGLFHFVTPAALMNRVDAVVHTIRTATEPPSATPHYAVARRHLLQAYSWAAAGFALAGAGIATFFHYPSVPIAVPFAVGTVCAVVINFVPKKWLAPAPRAATFSLACLSAGYTLGPMNWIAYDALLPTSLILASTVVGFAAPLFITRGMVSYFLSSQLLSSSLAILSTRVTSESTVVSSDVNVMLTLQIFANALLGIFHTIPTIGRCVFSKETPEALELELDPMQEGFRICMAAGYCTWRLFRTMCYVVIRKAANQQHQRNDLTRDERQGAKTFVQQLLDPKKCSNVLASVLFFVCYIRFVSACQERSDTTQRLERLRKLFVKLSPFTLLSKMF